jgi:hypothetical protein
LPKRALSSSRDITPRALSVARLTVFLVAMGEVRSSHVASL